MQNITYLDILTPDNLAKHLSLTEDAHAEDGDLLRQKLVAASRYIELLTGRSLETVADENGGNIPAPLAEAVFQLAAFWYEHREAASASDRVKELPFGIWEIVNEYRERTF